MKWVEIGNKHDWQGRGGTVVNVLAFYSDDQSLNLAGNLLYVPYIEKTIINKKERLRLAHKKAWTNWAIVIAI